MKTNVKSVLYAFLRLALLFETKLLDILSTQIGIKSGLLSEANPVVKLSIDTYGLSTGLYLTFIVMGLGLFWEYLYFSGKRTLGETTFLYVLTSTFILGASIWNLSHLLNMI